MSKNKIIYGVLIISAIVATVFIVYILSTPTPNVEIISHSASDYGSDAIVYVTVFNRGSAGRVAVWVELEKGGQTWKKVKGIDMESKESRDLTFVFYGLPHNGPTNYKVWIEE